MWLKTWRREQRRLKRSFRNGRLHGMLEHRLFARSIWRLERLSVAGGLSLGLFIAFTPTIPFQMAIAAIAAVYLRVNLPAAVLACWVTNPLTALPVYMAAWELGKFIFEAVPLMKETLSAYSFETRAARVLRQTMYLWTGSLVFAVGAAAAGNLAVRLLWKPRTRRAASVFPAASPAAPDPGAEAQHSCAPLNGDASTADDGGRSPDPVAPSAGARK
jgi:hypothetical protein